MSVEKQLKATSGYGMLAAVIAALLAIVGLFIWSLAGIAGTPDGVDAPAVYGWGLGLSIVAFCFWFLPLNGFFSLQPGQARVCILFGKYVGTVRDEGFFWANPFFSRSMGVSGASEDAMAAAAAKASLSLSESVKAAGNAAKGLSTTISTRVRTLNGERLKVNDKMGNPIEIATVVVWHVADTAKALFDVDDYQSYVAMQAETALRHVASVYAYDHLEDESDAAGAITLRANVEEVSEALRRELAMRLAPAGVEVDDARLTHLAYSPRSPRRCCAASKRRPSSPRARRSSRVPSPWSTWPLRRWPRVAPSSWTTSARRRWPATSWWCSAVNPRRTRS